MTSRTRDLHAVRIALSAFAVVGFAPSPAPGAERDAWTIDPAGAHIAFAIDAVGYPRTQGEFHRFEGRIAVDFARWDRSSVVFHVQSASVDVGSPTFSDYVRSLAFLNAARFPSIDFVSKTVERVDDHTVRVSGDLTLLGVTKPLAVEVAVRRENEGGRTRLVFRAQTHIDRLEFGMNSGFPLVSREIDLVISSEGAEL
jgi:polyisoprenoid-binding protein YceI